MDEARGRQFLRDLVGIGDPRQSMYSLEEMRAYVEAEAAYFEAHAVRGVVIGFTLTALLSTRLAGIPLITEHAGSYLPPLFERGMLPAPSRPVQPIFRYLPASVARFLVNRGATRPRLYLKHFDALADELGIPRIPSFPALLLGDLSLVTEAPEVYGISEEEMQAWRPKPASAYWPTTRLEYTGPIFAEFDLPVPADVEAALERPGPKVYVAITSAPAALTRKVVKALEPLGANLTVAGTVHDLSDLSSATVTVGGVLPSHRIMPRVDFVVTAGGQGSMQCAMAAGTPAIGIPLQPEQDTNVHMLELRGAAKRVPERDIGSGRLLAVARQMLSDESFGLSARRIKAAYAERDGPGLSADAILRFVRKSSAKPSLRARLRHSTPA
jgi:UDP:flavonoid glycosyltransferase YjiC (YdhE family)